MALSAICLIDDLDNLKPWLRIALSETSQDTILEDLANSLTEEIEALTGRIFVERSVTEQRIGDGSGQLRLRYFPIATDVLDAFTVDDEDVEADDYVLDGTTGVITLLDGGTFAHGSVIDLSYVAGYADLPARVVQLAKEMIKIRYDLWISNSSGVTSFSQGQASMVPLPDWPYAIKHTLEALKREANP